MYAAKRFSCGPGAERRDPTKQFYIRMFFCDPVVLVHSPRAGASVAWFARQEERPRIEQTIATEAAIRNDAHLVKYTWACLDCAVQDPAQAPLFHAAAA